MFGDVIVEQAGVTNVIKGQTLETIAGVCDGRTLEGRETTYTLDNVTSFFSMKMEQEIQNIQVIQMEQTVLFNWCWCKHYYSYVTGSQITSYNKFTKQIYILLLGHCRTHQVWEIGQ